VTSAPSAKHPATYFFMIGIPGLTSVGALLAAVRNTTLTPNWLLPAYRYG
jgi:hypothetical protein